MMHAYRVLSVCGPDRQAVHFFHERVVGRLVEREVGKIGR